MKFFQIKKSLKIIILSSAYLVSNALVVTAFAEPTPQNSPELSMASDSETLPQGQKIRKGDYFGYQIELVEMRDLYEHRGAHPVDQALTYVIEHILAVGEVNGLRAPSKNTGPDGVAVVNWAAEDEHAGNAMVCVRYHDVDWCDNISRGYEPEPWELTSRGGDPFVTFVRPVGPNLNTLFPFLKLNASGVYVPTERYTGEYMAQHYSKAAVDAVLYLKDRCVVKEEHGRGLIPYPFTDKNQQAHKTWMARFHFECGPR